MKTQLATIIIALACANGFVMHGTATIQPTRMYAEVNHMWAHDAYGRNTEQGGRLPSELVIHEDDPWYYHPWSGVSQSDFYPQSQAGNRLITEAPATPLPPAIAAAASPAPLPASASEEPMPEPSAEIPEEAVAQA